MRTRHVYLLSAIALGLSLTARGQGSLTPPGAPAPTMKTLDQVEARTPVDQVHTPTDGYYNFVISKPGSYYLTDNFSANNSQLGISITTNNVTLDLNGFTLTGLLGTMASGIRSWGNDVVIRNGTIRRWGREGIYSSGTNLTVEGVNLAENGYYGLEAGPQTTVARCNARGHTVAGIVVGDSSHLTHCTAVGNWGTAFGSPTAGDGFSVASGTLDHCVAVSNNIGIKLQGTGGISECQATGNNADGFNAGDRVRLEHCTATGNTGSGFTLGQHALAQGCSALGNAGAGFSGRDDAHLSGCTANENKGGGFRLSHRALVENCSACVNRASSGSTNACGFTTGLRASLTGCTAQENGYDGFSVLGDSILRECKASWNGLDSVAAGIRTGGSGSRLEGNQMRDNQGSGILAGSADIIARNSSGANSGANYTPRTGTYIGPIQAPATATSPLANIEF